MEWSRVGRARLPTLGQSGRAFNMCGDVATPNLYAVAQQNCLQAPDTKTTVMGRRSGSSSSNGDVERAGATGLLGGSAAGLLGVHASFVQICTAAHIFTYAQFINMPSCALVEPKPPATSTPITAHIYLPCSDAMSLSGARNCPRLSVGGTIASM